jgi:hypothetical protein
MFHQPGIALQVMDERGVGCLEQQVLLGKNLHTSLVVQAATVSLREPSACTSDQLGAQTRRRCCRAESRVLPVSLNDLRRSLLRRSISLCTRDPRRSIAANFRCQAVRRDIRRVDPKSETSGSVVNRRTERSVATGLA